MQSEHPTVRFVVPTLGRNLDWLELCLRSISAQSIMVDLVVVSPKGAPVEELAVKYGGRVMHERGRSLSDALNQGFADMEPSVRYLAWLGDDDVLAPGSLALTVGALENEPAASLVLGRLRYIDEQGRSKWVVRSGAWAASYAKIGKNFMGQPGSLMQRKAFEEVGGLDPNLKNSMDQDLFLKLSKVGKIIYLPRELAAFRVHATSISSTKGASDESSDVSGRYAPDFFPGLMPLVRKGVWVVDKVLLSTLSRIPHRDAIFVDEKPYYHV